VVNSPKFVSSARLCRFLSHIVNRAIDGDLDNLKEFTIAMEVFDRTSDYDPNIDAIVRVEARRLRAKLKAYYEDGPGTADPVLIALRPGSYVPIFRRLDSRQPSDRLEIGAAIRPGRASVAVLPFVNMSPEPEQDYFCDGITEEIVNSLTRVSGLNVIARTSAFQFKGASVDIRDVGQRLGADLVIEGSVRKSGEHLRITAQAIQTESGHHLWSETFRRELKDVFVIQEEIAQSVADLLRLNMPAAKASVRSSARNLEAYTRHLRARFLIHQQTPESLQAAAQQLRSLIELFPDYAVAYSGLAEAIGLLCLFGVVSGRDVYPEVKASAERGYALDPESGETCTMLAGLRSWFEHRWEEAKALYDRALQLQPGFADAHSMRAMTLLCQGNIIEAESSLRRSTELDPLSASDCARMAYLYYVKGDHPSAVEHLQQSFDLDRDYPEALLYEGLLRFQQEDYEGVVQCLSASLAPMHIGVLAAAYARQGSLSRSNECVEKLRKCSLTRYVTPLAEAFAALGIRSRLKPIRIMVSTMFLVPAVQNIAGPSTPVSGCHGRC
jgi:adenylate cyclase